MSRRVIFAKAGPIPGTQILITSMLHLLQLYMLIHHISCDPNSQNNPVPAYSGWNSFDKPTIPHSKPLDGPELGINAIDHLPTLIPRESSNECSALLFPAYCPWHAENTSAFRGEQSKDTKTGQGTCRNPSRISPASQHVIRRHDDMKKNEPVTLITEPAH